jgi:hypothetical protein
MATADNKPNTDCGSPQDDPNYRYGDGRVNCFAAVSAVYNQDIPWVWEDPITGTVPPEGAQPVDITFHCTITELGQTLTGTLRINHNDPCAEPVDVPLTLHCVESADPDIVVTPPSLSQELCPDATATQQLTICNEGVGVLNWTTSEVSPTIPWLSENPTSGTVMPGACVDVAVTFDSTGLAPGDYFGNLVITSNDPDEPQVTVPVQMTVLEPVDLASVTYTINGFEVTFDATATGAAPLTFAWDFGDGGTSNLEDPTHVYTTGGCYQVTLTVSNQCGEVTWTGQVCLNRYIYLPVVFRNY